VLRFTFESFFKDKAELREEIARLLWQIDYIWPSSTCPAYLDWVKEKSDKAFVKINGGAQRQSLVSIKDIHQHESFSF
jgi:hypothetical protein